MPIINTNGIQLYYEERGSEHVVPLIMIMGITAPGSVWEQHTLALEKHFRCIIVDNRGVGQSEKPKGDYTTAQMADDYAGLMETLNIENANVVGVSMGSTIAQQLALRHPKKVKSLVLMCPWARCDNQAKGIFQHIINCKAKFDAEQFALYIQLLIYSKASWDDKNVESELAERRNNALTDENPQPFHGLKSQAMACINHNVLADLPKIYQKTLVIGGKEDIFTPEWMAKEVAENIPNSELFLYDRAGHIFHFEHLDDFNEKVINWFLKIGN